MKRLAPFPHISLTSGHGSIPVHCVEVLGLMRRTRWSSQGFRRFIIGSTLRYRQTLADSQVPIPNPSQPRSLDNIRSETAQKLENSRRNEGIKKDSLLANDNISNKEQRKADWAIMKEMSRYLWPKVEPTCRRSRT